jgi:hypothetical protein
MRRKTFDILASLGGLVLVAALLIAGALATWGYSFANSNVHDQLTQQQITFPAKGSSALASPEIGPYLNQYAGQQLTTGDQAKAYADHFIAVHLSEMPYGGVYAKVSAAAQANPTNATLRAEVQTVFQGTTLRGLLLEAYAFSVFATIAFWAATAAFSLAFLMALLVGFGFWHARRTPENTEILTHSAPQTAAAQPRPSPRRRHPVPRGADGARYELGAVPLRCCARFVSHGLDIWLRGRGRVRVARGSTRGR